jgi:colicin import membrane protein
MSWVLVYVLAVLSMVLAALAGVQTVAWRNANHELTAMEKRLATLEKGQNASSGQLDAAKRHAEDVERLLDTALKSRADAEQRLKAVDDRLVRAEAGRQTALREASDRRAAAEREHEAREAAEKSLRSALDEIARLKADLTRKARGDVARAPAAEAVGKGAGIVQQTPAIGAVSPAPVVHPAPAGAPESEPGARRAEDAATVAPEAGVTRDGDHQKAAAASTGTLRKTPERAAPRAAHRPVPRRPAGVVKEPKAFGPKTFFNGG